MSSRIISITGAVIVGLIIIALVATEWIAHTIDDRLNRVIAHEPYTVSPEAQVLHSRLHLADLHGDSLLWDRNILKRHNYGHIDVPRLIEGRHAIQNFTIVTKSPSGQNMEENTGDTDQITQLVIVNKWPVRTWGSLTERALYQADKLHRFASRSDDLMVVAFSEDVAALMTARNGSASPVGGLLGIEGSHALEGDLANLERLYAAGIRTVGLHHFFDNALGGSAHGVSKEGLTDFGKSVVQYADQLGMIIDVAHSSPASIDDVLELATRPIIDSHTGVRGQCDNQRNLYDRHAAAIGDGGGLIGIGFWDWAVCESTPAAIARGIRYAVDVAGIDHVAFGSDYDGSIKSPLDTSESVVLIDELIKQGFSDEEIEKISGGNVIAFMERNLPHRAQ